MERCGGNVAASMESHGQLSSGCGVGGVTRQLATDAVVCTVSQCLDSWQQMQWYASSQRVTTAGVGMLWTLDQVKFLFLSVDD